MTLKKIITNYKSYPILFPFLIGIKSLFLTGFNPYIFLRFSVSSCNLYLEYGSALACYNFYALGSIYSLSSDCKLLTPNLGSLLPPN